MPSTSLWVQSHTSVWGDQETRDLRRSLGLEPLGVHGKAATVGYLHALWHYAADHQKDGDFSRYSDSDLAEAVNWPGDPHQFKDALLGSGHLTPECKIKDWDFYFISHWKARESNRARQSEFRGRHNARETDVTVTSALSNAHANGDVTVSVTRLPVPIPGPD